MAAQGPSDDNSSKPTIVLIPGSFCSGGVQWDPVIDKLHSAGYETLALELPTVGPPSTAPAKRMADDAAHIHGVIEALANDGKDVVVTMSSYGGIPATQALKGVTRKERQEQSQTGGVTGLIYVSSVILNEGESSNNSFAGFPVEHGFFRVSGEYAYLDPIAAGAAIFAELPKEVGESWARKMPGQALGAFEEKMTSTSHYDVPITYLKCTEDNIILPAHQQKMIDDIKSVSRSSVTVVELASGHCPMISHVDKTTEIILNAVEKL